MIYVALLRGVNVGGNKRVPMALLRAVVESLGARDVRTYINSGNVLFRDDRPASDLRAGIEEGLCGALGFEVEALVVDKPTLDGVALALPDLWRNDETTKCDVLFLWDEANTPAVLESVAAVPGVDEVRYVDGALLWCARRSELAKSGMSKLIGTTLYKRSTVRNATTTRKLHELASDM